MSSEYRVFNSTIALDVMIFNGKSALHCVDVDAKFNAAAILTGKFIADIWNTFTNIWVTIYIGHSEHVAVDRGKQFSSDEFTTLCKRNDVQMKISEVESNNPLGVGECYYSYL